MQSDELALRPDHSPVSPDARKAEAYALNSRSEATRRAYASDWRAFVAWCEAREYPFLPADPRHVAGYVADQADHLKPATLRRRLASIAVAHKSAGLPSPIGLEPVPATMSGIRRHHGAAQTKKAPVRVANLRSAFVEFPTDLRGKRDKALLLLGYAGAFRRSELVALTLADVEFRPEGATVTVRKSKTDQEGQGHRKAIPFGKDKRTCPVRALKEWIKAGDIGGGPLFRRIDRWGRAGLLPLAGKTVGLIVKDRAHLLGLDPDAIGAHSLRAGLVTDGYAAGASESDIMRQTGHRSRAVLEGYRREANLFQSNVAERIGL